MAEKRVKLDDGNKGGDEPKTMVLDRLSDLPDPIIHQIFSLVPTIVAVRMTVLSKRWKEMWYHLPLLTFSDHAVDANFDQKKFFKFVDTCLELRKSDLTNVTDAQVTRFKLWLSDYDHKNNRPINGWLNSVAQSTVTDLLVHINYGSVWYRLPLNLLQSQSLTILRLSGVRFWGVKTVILPSLISLSLENIHVIDKGFRSILSGCCSLEKLLIKNCGPLYDVEISNFSLKSVEVDDIGYYARFYVKAQNLQSFSCNESRVFVLFLSHFHALRSLSFTSCVKLYDDRLEELIPELQLLKSLTICECESLFSVKISSQHLKHLVFRGNGGWGIGVQASVDCPNLVDFSYDGFLNLNFATNPQKLFEAEIRLGDPRDSETSWHINLLDFLSSLNCSENIILDVRSEEDLILPDELKITCQAPLPILKHLQVKTRNSPSRNAELRNSLNWIAPSLETLSME